MRLNSRWAVAAGVLALVAATLLSPPALAEVIQVAGSAGQPGMALKSQAPTGVELRYAMDSFTLDPLAIDGQEYQKLSLAGVLLPNNAGAPDLPGLSRYLAVPQGARAVVTIPFSKPRSTWPTCRN